MAEAARQHEAIDVLNAAYGGRFKLLRGIEANIGADGALDLSAEEARQFELVLAAPHSKLRKAEDQTGRMRTSRLKALRNGQKQVTYHAARDRSRRCSRSSCLLRAQAQARRKNRMEGPLTSGRGDWIRTSDLSVPNRALYQAEPRPDGKASVAC